MDKSLAEHLWARALGSCCLTVSLAQDVVWWSRVQNGGCGAQPDPWVITEC